MFSVLYVDDERDLLELGKLFLEQSPEFHIEIALSARDALASLAIQSFDAIVSDYQMPEMDGIAFLKTVRQQYGNIPFILFTGRGREEIVIEAINNGVDFYLQKGGDVKSQFAELSHKIRQAVARQQAENSLVESEKRLADIIDFLPDATFAINKEGIIIAWNRAIEKMTGSSAAAMLGKGDHEYAIPFYGERRPLLIDLVSATEDEVSAYYTNILREGVSLTAETNLPHPKGSSITVLAKASPLYNREGQVTGAIEAIRDITGRKKEEDELRAAYEMIAASEEELREQLDVLEKSEQKIRESEARLWYMIGFYEKARGPEQELLSYAVEGAGAVTESPLGYLAFLNDDESELSMYAWSKSAMKECAMRDKPLVYKTEKTGLWGEAVRQRRPVITNDYAAPNPAKKGYPSGHPEIVRHMNVPIMDEGHIVLVAGVANKPEDYTKTDIQELLLLMQGLWFVIKRRRTEQALFESEEKYRDLFENSVLGIFRTTLEGKFSAINATFARIAGYDSPQEMMEAITDIRTQLYVNPDDRDRFEHALIRDGVVKNFEARYKHRDGHPVWILISAMAVRDMQGEVRYYEGTVEEITEQKKAEEALRQEKIFSDAVLDSIPGLLYLYDSDGRLVRWNQAHEAITGYSDEDLAGMHLLDWYKGDDQAIATITERVGQALREGQATAEADLLTKSGKRIPFFFTAKRLEIDGKMYFTGVGIDITEQKRAQNELRAAYEQITASEEALRAQLEALAANQVALRASEEKFRDLVETSPDLIWEMDTRGMFTYMSPRCSALIGYLPEEVVGKMIFSFVPDYALPPFEEIFATSIRTKKPPAGIDLPLRSSDGHIVIMEIRAVPLLDRDDQFIGLRGIARDITEKKKASDELQAAYEQLMASDDELQGQYEELEKSEQRIRESEEKAQNVIDFSPFGMHFYILHEDGSLVFTGANPAADSILNVDNSQFIGRTIEDAFPGLAGTEIPDQYRRVALSGEPWHTDQVNYDKGMIQGAFSVSAFQIRPGAMVAAFFDITERKKAEIALKESEERLQLALAGADLGTWNWNIETGEVVFNERWAGMLGYRLDEIEPDLKSWERLVHPEDMPKVQEILAAHLEGRTEFYECEYRMHHKDGSWLWVLAKGRVTRRDENGRPRFAAGTHLNTTQRKLAEETLRESESRFRLITENMVDQIIQIDVKRVIRFISPSVERHLGFPSDELIGNLITDYLHPDDTGRVIREVRAAIDAHLPSVRLEYRYRHQDGRFRWFESEARLLYDDSGVYTGAIFSSRDIDQRKQMEEELREKTEEINQYFTTSLDLFCIADTDGYFRRLNPEWENTLGYPLAELEGRRFIDFVHPDDREATLATVFELVSQKKVLNFTNRFRHKDGTYRWIEWRSLPRGNLIFAAARDITARRETEEKYRKLFERSNDAIFIADPKTRKITDCNIKAELMTGYSRNELLGIDAASLHPEDVRAETMGYFREFLKGETNSIESVVLAHDGRRVPVSINAGPVEVGGQTLLIGTFRDISRQKQAEKAISESEGLYRSVIDNLEDAFIRSNTEGRIIMASPSAARMLGYDTPDDIIGQSFFGFYRYPEIRQSLLDKMSKEGKILDQTIELRRKDGSTFWGSVNAHFLYNEKGDVSGIEGFIHDVTESLAMERAIREANHKLNLLNSMTRHDVVNQLTILQGFAQIASMKKGDPVMADYLAKIITAAETIARQIEFTRTYQELGVKAPAWILVENVIAPVESRVPITFSGTCRGIEIYADPMLERVFFNLVDNAVRHGGRVTEITVRCEREPDSLLLIVEDNGMGIPVADKSKIFERGVGKNTGLGLFLAREILSITGITITETGIYGKGARFEMSVPKGMYRFV